MLSTRAPIDVTSIEAGLEMMKHRGPNGAGVWARSTATGPWVTLGHRRLSIIDLSEAAAQPMSSPDGAVVLTFNGEIYNYRELMQELADAGWSFRSRSDTEVLLTAYRQWGAECLSRLNGMFAFAIWDESRQELFAARDRFGEKPFHYVFDAARGQFAFASEMKALFAAGLAQVELNDGALQRYAISGILDGDRETIYRGVHRLPASHALRVSCRDGGLDVSEWRYWTGLEGAPFTGDGRRAAEQFRALFEESIRLRLRSDVPVGTSLSGGLDSSAVICTIQRIGAAGGQKAFSARMSDPKLDEGNYIRAVLEQTGIGGYEVVPTVEELKREFSRMCFHMEEPFPATSMFAQFLVMRLAQQHGVTVLLDGQGADELLAGYGGYFRLRYGDLLRSGYWRTLAHELQQFALLRDGQRVLTVKGLAGTLLPQNLHERLLRSDGRPGFDQWWNAEWRESRAGSNGVYRPLPYFNRLDAGLRHDSLGGPLQELLRFGDRNSMAWSRELRQPFLDHRLAEFVYSLPPEHKISGGMTKVVLRRAMEGVIPDEITRRIDKLGYQAPLGQWLLGELRTWTEERLEAAEHVLEGRAATGLTDRFRRLRPPLDEWGEARAVFRLLTLSECVRQMRDVRTGASLKAAHVPLVASL